MGKVEAARMITPDVRLFQVRLTNGHADERLRFHPGQFAFLSAFGVGESPFGLASRDDGSGLLEFAVRRVGTVTLALHELETGDDVGVRGPFGNWFPMDEYKGKKLLIIGGGIGFAPLRPVIQHVLANRADYADVTIINGARSPADLCFASEFESWSAAPDVRLELTVDRGDDKWKGRVALIPAVVDELKPSPENTVAITCGPPIMIKFVLQGLHKLGFQDEQIVTTLESKMKCGMGKCARCNVGGKYVCVNGPVFTFAQISKFIEQF